MIEITLASVNLFQVAFGSTIGLQIAGGRVYPADSLGFTDLTSTGLQCIDIKSILFNMVSFINISVITLYHNWLERFLISIFHVKVHIKVEVAFLFWEEQIGQRMKLNKDNTK